MTRIRRALCRLLLLTLIAAVFNLARAQSSHQPASRSTPAQQTVPVIDGGAGACSLELTVTTADGKPVYAARVKVHIAYGFAGVRKLDLDAGTNVDGKVKFAGLPGRVHSPPLEFQASKDQLTGTAAYNPDSECHARHDIILVAPKAH